VTDPIASVPPALRQPGAAAHPAPQDNQALRRVAEELEASFLTEMLKHAGFGEERRTFGGGVGEAQFASFLRSEHSRALVERGGIGLSQSLFEALVSRQSGPPETLK
jgi:peptidoglycan hydrolase FlgJ